MKIINLTPHTVHFPDFSIEPSGKIARCKETSSYAGHLKGIELIYRDYEDVYDLPDYDPQNFYIVSMLVRQALPNRHDIGSPGDLLRDGNGNIIGATNLVINR